MRSQTFSPSGPRRNRWWLAGGLAGIVGGIAMGLYAMLTSAMLGRSIWTPINAIAATLPPMRPSPSGFAVGHFVVGSLIHLIVAAVWGIGLAAYIRFESQRQRANFAPSMFYAALFGPVWGVVTWIVMGLIIAPRVSPVYGLSDQIQYLAGHLVYGMVTAWSYAGLARRYHVRITFAPHVAITKQSDVVHH